MTNEKLKEIKERLLTENNKRRRMEQEQANACANYYERGVNDALTAVSFTRPEQQNQPASETRTNLDRIRAMSAEEIAEWAASHLECCSPGADVAPVVHGRWIRFKETDPKTGYMHMKCSVCSAYWSDPSHADHFHYCPNCGAKMEDSHE